MTEIYILAVHIHILVDIIYILILSTQNTLNWENINFYQIFVWKILRYNRFVIIVIACDFSPL